jgi:hypothetical protein
MAAAANRAGTKTIDVLAPRSATSSAPSGATVTPHVPARVDVGPRQRRRPFPQFDTRDFPQATFASTAVTRTGPNTGKMTGDLKLRGVTKPVTFDVTFNGGLPSPMGGNGYNLGFHATGTVGCFGAAAACARLLGLDADATAQALGIAGTQASGLKSQFGTMCKPFHAGKASHNGLLAARLAARGFSGRPDLVECEQGFALTHAPDFEHCAEPIFDGVMRLDER